MDRFKNEACRVLIAGVGGGGCSLLSNALENWPDAPDTVAINTDMEALKQCRVELRLCIGKAITQGLGAGGDTEIGRLAALEDRENLSRLVSGHDLLIIVASLGGGTASGVAPVLGDIAREEGVLSMAYVTMPFSFEGERRTEQAVDALRELKKSVDAVVRLPQDRLQHLLPPEATLMDAYKAIDRMLATGIRSLWMLLTENMMNNIDFSDLQSLVEHSGNECSFAYAEGSGPQKVDDALKDLLEGPITDGGSALAHAGAMLVGVVGGSDLALAELNRISERLSQAARPEASISIGAAVLPEWENRLAITILAAENWIPSSRNMPWPSGEGRGDSLFSPAERDEEIGKSAKKRSKKAGNEQMELMSSQADTQTRFNRTNPSMHGHDNLDEPTYWRRGFKIDSGKEM